MTEAGEAVVGVNLQHSAQLRSQKTTYIILRTVTLAVYIFVFEQDTIFAVFLPYKVFKKT